MNRKRNSLTTSQRVPKQRVQSFPPTQFASGQAHPNHLLDDSAEMNRKGFYCFRFGDDERSAKLQKQFMEKMLPRVDRRAVRSLKPRPPELRRGPASNGPVFVEDSLLIVMPDLFEAGGVTLKCYILNRSCSLHSSIERRVNALR